MSEALFKKFGSTIVEEVRDRTIEEWKNTVNGVSAGIVAEEISENLKTLSDEQKRYLRDVLIPYIVDSSLFYTLHMFETQRWLHIMAQDGDEKVELSRAADFGGYIFGWIEEFSEHPPSEW